MFRDIIEVLFLNITFNIILRSQVRLVLSITKYTLLNTVEKSSNLLINQFIQNAFFYQIGVNIFGFHLTVNILFYVLFLLFKLNFIVSIFKQIVHYILLIKNRYSLRIVYYNFVYRYTQDISYISVNFWQIQFLLLFS